MEDRAVFKKENPSGSFRQGKIALLICAVLLFTLLFSAGFLAESAHHECSQDHCQVCAVMEMCEASISLLGLVTLIIAVCLLPPCLFIRIDLVNLFNSLRPFTLIHQKIRLNN